MVTGSKFAPLARVERGGRTESWHAGVATAVTPRGETIARAGDPQVATYIRSAAKPFQALPFVEMGGVEAFGLDAADLAVICASHNGLPEHVERVAALLERGGLAPEQLGCGVHWPYDAGARQALCEAGRQPTVLHNNCSGKHTGMLLACKLAGWPLDSYLDPGHPLQQAILRALAALIGVAAEEMVVAVDGCGAPCYYLSVSAAARAYAALAGPELAGCAPDRADALHRIAEAMAAAPGMVAGPGELTTRLIEVTGGRVIGKEGAEGFYALAIRGPVALGAALKIADGSDRARPGAVLDLLRQLGCLAEAEIEELRPFYMPEVRNRQGVAVGRIVCELEMETVAEEVR
ncbi:MAG: asparaginase [Thermoanaerobaculia bacterium]